MSARPTPGPWKARAFSSVAGCPITAQPDPKRNTVILAGVHGAFGDDYRGEVEANAALIAEAGTVYHETQLTPRKLADQRAELIEIVETFLGYDDTLIISVGGNPNVIEQMLSNAHAVLAKCTGAA